MKVRLVGWGVAIARRLRLVRTATLGVRGVVLGDGTVLLVRHTYCPGWYLPGGGVDPGESAETALVRELREEAGIVCAGRPALHGLLRHGESDHVACYVVRRFTVATDWHRPSWEIAETGFFPVERLPPDATPATRARIAEVITGQPPPDSWR